MATRQQTSQGKSALQLKLREKCRSGALVPGSLVPSLRKLALEFGISKDVAAQGLRELIDEGLLHTVSRVGTFVGRPQTTSGEFYLMLLPQHAGVTQPHHISQIQSGFERRLAGRGAASLAMPMLAALEARERGELPPLAGLFDFAYRAESDVAWGAFDGPRVGFAGRIEPKIECDVVQYDSRTGGALATRHLIAQGHQNIGFLALHPLTGETEFNWSRERECGWRDAMTQAGLEAQVACHPAAEPPHTRQGQIDAARAAASHARLETRVTAVVAANDFAALGLIGALQATGVPRDQWPAIVGFDNLPQINGYLLTSLELAPDEIGAAAADLLWERKHGLLQGPPQLRNAPMQLIPRLTSRLQWGNAANGANLMVTA